MKVTIKLSALALAGLFNCQLADAALVINFQQVGADVVITANGTMNVTGLTFAGNFMSGSTSDMFSSVNDQAFIRSLSFGNDIYFLPYLHPLFSSNIPFTNGVSAGDNFGLFSDDLDNFFVIFVPDGFTSGSINGSLTFTNTDLASLGVNTLADGSWGPGAEQSLSITTGTAAIPEPATYMALLGFTSLGLLLWRRRRKSAAAA